MRRSELAAWLCGPDAVVPPRERVLAALGLPAGAAASPESLRFVLAVLRDLYPGDLDVRRWLRLRRAELGGSRPADLLLAGRIAEVEELAVADWHTPEAAESVTA
jgi:hypothetical protein